MKPLTAKKALLWAIAATLVGCVVMAVHVPLEAWTKMTIASQQELLASIAWREPAEHGWVMVLAAITAIIPVLATMLLAWLIWDRLPARSWWARGLLLWLLLLLLDGALLRQPIMNLAVGNPASLTLAMVLDPWASKAALAFPIAAILGFIKPARTVTLMEEPV